MPSCELINILNILNQFLQTFCSLHSVKCTCAVPQLLIIYSTLPAEHSSIAVFLSAYRPDVNIDAGPGELECCQLFYD